MPCSTNLMLLQFLRFKWSWLYIFIISSIHMFTYFRSCYIGPIMVNKYRVNQTTAKTPDSTVPGIRSATQICAPHVSQVETMVHGAPHLFWALDASPHNVNPLFLFYNHSSHLIVNCHSTFTVANIFICQCSHVKVFYFKHDQCVKIKWFLY